MLVPQISHISIKSGGHQPHWFIVASPYKFNMDNKKIPLPLIKKMYKQMQYSRIYASSNKTVNVELYMSKK